MKQLEVLTVYSIVLTVRIFLIFGHFSNDKIVLQLFR